MLPTPSWPVLRKVRGESALGSGNGVAPGQVGRGRSACWVERLDAFFDVLDGVDGEWAHEHAQRVDVRPRRVLGDLVLTQAAGNEGLALHALDGARCQHVGDVVGEVAKVDEAPPG